MKKIYLFLIFSFFYHIQFAQLTVSSFANNYTVCGGNSTTITASATPISYTASSITTNLLPDYGVNILADGAGITGVTPIPRSGGINNNDARWDNIPIPFTFRFYGNAYTSLNVSSNGWVNFSATTATTGFGFSLSNASDPNNAIHGVTANLTLASTGVLEYFADGTAPNRVFVVSYQNVPFASGGGTTTFQIQLHEAGNVVEVHTSGCNNTTLGKAQGVENAAGTAATIATGRNNSTTWSGFGNSFRFTPDVINFAWSPATYLNTTSGATVTATPTSTTTYTINATNASNGQTGSNTVTITVDAASNTLAAAAGGASVCQNISVTSGGTSYRDGNCNLITNITPSGATPVNNVVNSCVKVDANSTKRGTSDLYLARKYDIEPQVNAANATATLKLYYLQSEFDNFNTKAADSGHKALPINGSDATGISNLVLRQFHGTGTNPTNYTGAAVDFTTAVSGFTVVWDATKNWWEVTVPVNGFSGFYLTSKKVGTVNIGLIYFKGVQIDKKNVLNWKVNCSSNQAKFEVQRSTDGISYSIINLFTASKERCNTPFTYTDEDMVEAKNYYRLKFIDVDGKTTISNIVLLTQKQNGYSIVSLNPNIVTTQNPILKIDATEKQAATIVISDFTGRVFYKQTNELQIGLNQISLPTAKLAAGAYVLTTYTSGNKPQTVKLIKQ